MTPLADAQKLIDEMVTQMPAVEIGLADGLGFVLAEDVYAPESVPGFVNSAMDGFAVIAADVKAASKQNPAVLEIVDTVTAGDVPEHSLQTGQAARIMTGAAMPAGADAVVMVELTRSTLNKVEVLEAVPVGNHFRHVGDDMEKGQLVFAAGDVLGPAHLGVLAAIGKEKILVVAKPKVGVFSTGNELVEGGVALLPGQIRDANRLSLISSLRSSGFLATDFGIVADTANAVETALAEASAECDVVISSGGVSMGDADYVKKVLKDSGDFEIMQVAIKPAKPLVFGILGSAICFGLPGNPVSAMVSFELFARPALLKMSGRLDIHRPRVAAKATEAFRRPADNKIHFQRVNLTQTSAGTYLAQPSTSQGSHQLLALAAAADGLAIIASPNGVEVGDQVEVMMLHG